MDIEEFLSELSEDGYIVPPEGAPEYATLIEAIWRAVKISLSR
jgi:hypothetical protein